MSGTASDGEGSVGHEADFENDATADTEVDMRFTFGGGLEAGFAPGSCRNNLGSR